MRRPSWGLLLAAVLVAALAGLAAGVVSPGLDQAYREARTTFRQTLGLPKSWFPVPGPDQARGRSPVACPDPSAAAVLVTGGQSNAANANSALSSAGAGVSVWFDGRCWPAADPVLGASGVKGSLWPVVGESLAATLDRPVLLINGAIGGTQVGDWLDPRSGYYAALGARVAAARRAGYEPDLVLWHQGETDAAVVTDMAALEAQFGELADRLLADMPGARLYLFRTSKCSGPRRIDGVEGVRAAQTAVARARDRVIAGLNTDELGHDFRWDTCHFNSLGREEIAARLAPELAGLLR